MFGREIAHTGCGQRAGMMMMMMMIIIIMMMTMYFKATSCISVHRSGVWSYFPTVHLARARHNPLALPRFPATPKKSLHLKMSLLSIFQQVEGLVKSITYIFIYDT